MNDEPIIEQPIEPIEKSAKPEPKTAKKQPLTRSYLFPDIDHGGPSVTIEATSMEEAIKLFRQQKGQTTQSS